MKKKLGEAIVTLSRNGRKRFVVTREKMALLQKIHDEGDSVSIHAVRDRRAGRGQRPRFKAIHTSTDTSTETTEDTSR